MVKGFVVCVPRRAAFPLIAMKAEFPIFVRVSLTGMVGRFQP
jgi:hypothetical protein